MINLVRSRPYIYLVSEEDAVVFVATRGINPGIADEMDITVARNIFYGEGLEVKLAMVMVLDDDGAWNAEGLVPIEYDVERGLAFRRE